MTPAPPPLAASAAAPLWATIAAQVTAEMAAGRIADGARLPPEREMAAAFGVAIGTLRRALASLEEKGLLTRRQGSGNYARHAGLGREMYGLFRLERADGVPCRPRAEVLGVDEIEMPAGLPFPRAVRIRRLRRLKGPDAVEEIHVNAAHGRLAPGDLLDSLYLTYALRLGVHVATVEDRIGVHAMPAWVPDTLGPGATAGFVARSAWDRDGAMIETSRTWFDPVRVRYVNRQSRGAPA